ncbi:MAG: Ku protein, partial [Rhodococcus sp. (in: high G+C Gram-positive bacteria)]
IQTLLWPDEVRAAEFPSLEDAPSARPQEVKMATSLVESMSSEFDPTEYTDDYQTELRKLIDETLANGGEKVIHTEKDKEDDGEDAEVVDLVAALQRSVEAAGKNAKSGSAASAPAKKAPAKKAAAKKAPAKKAAAKKSTSAKSADSKADEAKGA